MLRLRHQVILLGMLASLLISCGEGEGEAIVLRRREPRTLLREGTALSEAEASRRVRDRKESLARSKSAQRLMRAVSRLQSSKDPDILVGALGVFLDQPEAAREYLDSITARLDHDSPDVRATTLEVLDKVDAERARRPLKEALRDGSAIVRRKAVSLISQQKDRDLSVLLPLLSDDDSRVQYAVVSHLAKGKIAPEILRQVAGKIEDMDGATAKVALSLLLPRRGELRDFDEVIAMLLDHRDPMLRMKTANELAKESVLTRGMAKKAIQVVLDDPDESVRSATWVWLKGQSPLSPPKFDPLGDLNERESSREALEEYLTKLTEALPK